ncbi:MAG: alkaline phosphatase D family protein [Polyangiaceae bacterium]|nr:alkaline phosphatase D family protein [Polyangiaceae bacterium]
MLTRRALLRHAGLTGLFSLAPSLTACGSSDDGGDPAPGDDTLPQYVHDGAEGPETMFSHGVASGDPLPTGVILWTRVSPAGTAPVKVWVEVSKNPEFTQRVIAEWIPEATDASRDYTVKVDADGLAAGTTYYYRFFAEGRQSPIGRTRTAPSGAVSRLRFAVVSCSSLAHGYFFPYREIAKLADLDAVIHLGDYIYEYASGKYGSVREYEPSHEILQLDDYRQRYAQYHRDPDLQEVHRQHPMIATWDDHESADNSWKSGAENHDPATEGDWGARLSAAAQAYFEWLPIREAPGRRVYRGLEYGDLVDLIMLDTRIVGRDEQASGLTLSYAASVAAAKNLLGTEQEAWLFERLEASTRKWKLLAQQVILSPHKTEGAPNADGGGVLINPDQWNGYAAARDRLFALLKDKQISDVVVLTGDVHSSWAFDVAPDPNEPTAYDASTGAGSLAVEFVTPAVSSPSGPFSVLLPAIDSANPHLAYREVTMRGYILLDLDDQRAQGAFFHVDQVEDPAAYTASFSAALSTARGKNHLVAESEPAAPRANPPALAP